jgi:hypothetical protein
MMVKSIIWLVAAATLASAKWDGHAATSFVSVTWNGEQYKCKCTPSDACWPASEQWKTLNASVTGNLVFNIPPAAVCHNTFKGISTYDAAACQAATASWSSEQWQ